MAPRKVKARANRPPLPPPQPSDYETDAPPVPVHVPLPPPRSNEELNFSVLGRAYPDLVAIEHVTPYAALYTFNLETQQWEKVGIEGTLFICQLTPSRTNMERYCVIIYNRRGLENFYLELTSSDGLEIADPYVILEGEEVVYGIWIFADPPPASTANCRAETGQKMMSVADRARSSREARERELNNGLSTTTEPTETASAALMGRQLPLHESFDQERNEDAARSINNHNSQLLSNLSAQQKHVPSPDSRPAQQGVLGQLFMKAKQDYHGRG